MAEYDFDAILDGIEPNKPSKPAAGGYDFEGALDEVTQPAAIRLHNSLTRAAGANPDEEAKRQRLAGEMGLRPAILPSVPEAEAAVWLKTHSAERILRESPALATWLENPDHALLAKDDLELLTELESRVRRTSAGKIDGPAFRRPGEIKASPARGFFESVADDVRRSFARAGQNATIMASELGVYDGDVPGLAVQLAEEQRRIERFPRTPEIEAGLREISGSQSFGEALDAIWRNPRAVLSVTLESIGASSPALVAAAGGSVFGPGGTAAGAGTGSFAVEYASVISEALTEGGTATTDPFAISKALQDPVLIAAAREKAVKRGVPIAFFDALTAGFAGRLLAGARNTATSVGTRLAGEAGLQAGGGAAGEAVAQLATDEFRPGEILLEAVAELPTALIEVPANYRTARERAAKAEQDAALLDDLNRLATASKLAGRAPEAFEQFIAQAAEDGPIENVYLDAEVLLQSGFVDQIAEVSPAVAEQIQEAIVTGGMVRIPAAEFAARIAPTEMSASLLDHLKTDPDGFSRAEAQQFMATEGERLREEVERVMAEQSQDSALEQSAAAVRERFKAALDAVGRFTPEVNDAYAGLVSAFYTTTAGKLNLTPEQFFERFPLGVQAEAIAGEQFNQAAIESPEFRAWFGDSKVVDADGKPLVVYHGTNADFDTFASETIGSNIVAPLGAPRGFYFAKDKDIAGRYAKGEGASVMPVYLQIENPAPTAEAFNSDDSYDGFVNSKIAVVRNPTQIKSAIGNRGTYDQNDPNILNQGARLPRASYSPSANLITLLKNADMTSFLHEAGHAFLEIQTQIAAELSRDAALYGPERLTEGERQIVADTNALLAWFGVRDLETWQAMPFEERRAHHEKFAESFERYLMEGKAPNLELQPLFQRFAAWLKKVYVSIRDFLERNPAAGELSDEVRQVMDRMLATDEQIRIAEQARSMLPLFESPEQAGMTPEAFAQYQALGQEATETAQADLATRGVRDMKWLSNARGKALKRLQKQAAAQRAEVQMEARREVMEQPIYRAWAFLTGKDTEGGEPAGKLSRAALVEAYGGYDGAKFDRYATLDWKRLTDLRMTADEGLHPDVVAEMFGFSSGDELVRQLLATERPAVSIDELTDQRMLEQYGDLATQEALELAADAAVHNEVRARFVATELKAISQATGQRKILASAAKEFAAAMINRLKVRNVRPGQYGAAEARAAKAAAAAMKAGDTAKAAAEKRNQLVNLYAARAAHDALSEIDAGVRYLRKFESAGTRKGLDADYTDQIDALLERFDLRRGQSLKAIDRRKSLAEWITAQRERGMEPDVPPALVDEAFRQSYKDMTVEAFRGLVDTVKQIEHLGRLKKNLLTAKAQREYAAARDEIVASIRENAGAREADTRTPTTNLGRLAQNLKRFWAAHIKAATWARVLDGGKDGGPMWEYLIRTANERGDRETTMRAEATQKLTAILAPVFKLGRMGGKGIYFPSIRRSLNREARLAIALNIGNAGNLQRLLGGEGWNEGQIVPVLETLTREEWDAVQAVWDHFESYRPEIGAKERRVYGREPDWVQPGSRLTEAFGVRGGYFPIKYDPQASQRAEEFADAEGAQRQLQGAFTSATTRRSFTKSRMEEVTGRPLLYTLSGLYSGVNDVIHDLVWHEWLIDANRLMRSNTIDEAIRTHYGPEVKAQFKAWIRDIAEGEKAAVNAGEAVVGRLRQGVSAAGLGFNVMSAAIQITGFNQSIVRVGAKWIGRGIAKFVGSPVATTREVVGKSSFMADRSRTQFRELNELRNRVQEESRTMRAIKLGTYFMMMRMQRMVDVPTWLGAYEKAIAAGNDEERSIALADQAVIDSQGSGMVKDLSAIERGGPALKIFTVFYSYMNTALNMGVAQTMTAKRRGKLAADYLMLYTVPAVMGFALKQALTPGDEGDDWEELARKLAAEQLSYLMGLMFVVREFQEAARIVTGAEGPRGYSGPAGVRPIPDALRFVDQAAQGEFDEAFRKSSINLIGSLTGLPAAQLNRSITGIEALAEDKTDNPAAVLFGYQEER